MWQLQENRRKNLVPIYQPRSLWGGMVPTGSALPSWQVLPQCTGTKFCSVQPVETAHVLHKMVQQQALYHAHEGGRRTLSGPCRFDRVWHVWGGAGVEEGGQTQQLLSFKWSDICVKSTCSVCFDRLHTRLNPRMLCVVPQNRILFRQRRRALLPPGITKLGT